jgi:hypothetical protein
MNSSLHGGGAGGRTHVPRLLSQGSRERERLPQNANGWRAVPA